MIDTKKFAEIISRSSELDAEIRVLLAIGDFVQSNMDRCKEEQNYQEWETWIDVLRDINDALKVVRAKYEDLTKELKSMRD